MQDIKVSYELAVALKEIGFDWEVNSVYFAEQPENVSFLEYYQGDGSGVTKNSTIQDDFFNSTVQPACTAPTLALAQKFFREVHSIHIQIYVMEKWLDNGNEMIIWFEVNLKTTNRLNGLTNIKSNMLEFGTYEEALEEGLIHACKLVKQ